MKTTSSNAWFYLVIIISGASSLASSTITTSSDMARHRALDNSNSKSGKYQDNNKISSKSSKAKVYASKSSKATKAGWAPNESFYGTYLTDYVTFVAEIDSITVSYECIKAYEDYVYVYIVLPQVTETLPTLKNRFTAITYKNSTNNTNLEYARFDFIIDKETQVPNYYCEGDYDESSVEDAIVYDKANPNNLTDGCNGYPWSKMFPSDGTC